MRPAGLNSMTLVLFIDHMKDHSSGCTFGGCASYAMTEQTVWRSKLFDTGLGLYTSNEWPSPLYVSYRAIGSCADYHQSVDNTAIRVGDTPSGSREAGVFYNTTANETTPGSHGEGTAYCGRITFCTHPTTGAGYEISTGIGQSDSVQSFKHVQSSCVGYSTNTSDWAHCRTGYSTDQCPHGWGNFVSYRDFAPGCYNGTYYPNPTPASQTDTFTGSGMIYLHYACDCSV